jgi:hypothetical protein
MVAAVAAFSLSSTTSAFDMVSPVGSCWDSARSADFVHTSLRRRHEVANDRDPALTEWLDRFGRDREEAALDFWHEMRKGADEKLREL